MMPMPPTSSDIEATEASSSAMIRLLLSAVSANWLRLRTLKSLIWPGLMRWRRVSVCVASLIAVRHPLLAHRLDVDHVGVAGQARRQIVGVRRRQIGPVVLRLRLRGRRDAEHFPFRGRKRHHDEIVLILAEGGLALGGEDADDAQRHAAHLDESAQRVLASGEQLAIDGLAEQHDEIGLALVVPGQSPARRDLPIGDRRVIGADALDRRRPVLVGIERLPLLADEIADLRDRRVLAPDRVRVRRP